MEIPQGEPGFYPGRCALELTRYRPLARAPRREEILAAYRHAKQRGLRFESLSYERNKTGSPCNYSRSGINHFVPVPAIAAANLAPAFKGQIPDSPALAAPSAAYPPR